MADPVALTSVIASGLVALAGLALTYRSGREQRRHDQRLAYDERAWQRKSEGLFDLITTCRSLVDAIGRQGSIEAMETLDDERGDYEATVREHIGVSEIGVRVGDVVHRLQDLVPIVEVYGSTRCREAFEDLRRTLRDSGYDPRASDRLSAVRRGKVAAIDAKDYRSAATARRLEREILEAARTQLTIDLVQTREKAERLIEAARESVRGEHAAA
ncbi:MAG TPA: hypothetical protein VFJ83_05835 [Nocardioidaceae bacterium]|nr:hypothetical protein [Nocardioidaceae bacterium]